MKTCNKCGIAKEDTEFSLLKSGNRSGHCQECHRTRRVTYRKVFYQKNRKEILGRQKIHYQENKRDINVKNTVYYQKNKTAIAASQKEYREEHREEIRTQKAAYYKENKKEISAAQRDFKHHLAPGDFERLLNKQGGVCAICSGLGGKRGFVVDHDHDSGKVRAILCSKCNIALGHLNDSYVIAQLAANYLRLHGK